MKIWLLLSEFSTWDNVFFFLQIIKFIWKITIYTLWTISNIIKKKSDNWQWNRTWKGNHTFVTPLNI